MRSLLRGRAGSADAAEPEPEPEEPPEIAEPAGLAPTPTDQDTFETASCHPSSASAFVPCVPLC